MITKQIQYADPFTGQPKTVEAHFHLNKNDVAMLTAEANDAGYDDVEKQFNAIIAKPNNNVEIFGIFKKFILRAYGKRQGSDFKKSPAISEEFESSEAFSEFIWGLMSNEKELGEFFAKLINGPALRAPMLKDIPVEGDVNSDSKRTPDQDEFDKMFRKWQADQEKEKEVVEDNVFTQPQPEVGEPTNVMTPPVDPSTGEEVDVEMNPQRYSEQRQAEAPSVYNPNDDTQAGPTNAPRRLQMVELEKMSFSAVQKGLAENRFRLPREMEQ